MTPYRSDELLACTECHAVKRPADFPADKTRPHGIKTKCRVCRSRARVTPGGEFACQFCPMAFTTLRARSLHEARFTHRNQRATYAAHLSRLAEYIEANSAKSDGCWEWTGIMRPQGYGVVGIEPFVGMYAHRAAYVVRHGSVPDGLFVCHHCDNPRCVRPDHLFAGTHTDNMRDASAKGRLWRQRTPA